MRQKIYSFNSLTYLIKSFFPDPFPENPLLFPIFPIIPEKESGKSWRKTKIPPYRSKMEFIFKKGTGTVVKPINFYSHLHSSSISHPSGKPMARRSISGKSTSSQRSLASISFSGLTTSSRYLMIQRSKYTR